MEKIESFLLQNIDKHAQVKIWMGKTQLPVYLQNTYHFSELTLLGQRYLLVEPMAESPSIQRIEKDFQRIHELTGLLVIYCSKKMTVYRRLSLIENRIPFLLKDGQIFLPFLGLALKSLPKVRREERTSFSPAAQLVYLYFLYRPNQILLPAELAKVLQLSEMTISRSLRELQQKNLVTYEIGGATGRRKEYQRISDPEYFAHGEPFLRSPIKKKVYVDNIPEGSLIAGIEALSEKSMLNSSLEHVRAMSDHAFKSFDLHVIENLDMILDHQYVELELWSYNPQLLTKDNLVDPCSLFITLRDSQDERIEMALEEILRGESWYTD